jgi:predicted nucleic acid-binding protein
MFIPDTDILSIFAKSAEIPLLHELFGEEMRITPAILQEITAPLDYGYEFPHAVINTIKSVTLNDEAIAHHHLLTQNKKLGKGECEAIAYCKSTSSIFITNDRIARETAIQFQVTVISLPALLRVLIVKKIRTRDEVKILLNKMKKNDNLILDPRIEKTIFS